jgi:hypothetical protein
MVNTEPWAIRVKGLLPPPIKAVLNSEALVSINRVAQDGAAQRRPMTDFGIAPGKPVPGQSSALMEFIVSKSQVTWLMGAVGAAAVIDVLAGISLIARLIGGV